MTAALRKIAMAGAQTEWATPPELFAARLDREFDFGLDVCARAENAKLPWYFTAAEDALSRSWRCHTGAVFMNPPYGLIGREMEHQRRNREISEQMAQLRWEKELAYRRRREANETVSTEALIQRNVSHDG